jgi:hypothetical protein
MQMNLSVGVCAIEDPKVIENELIALLCPPLNLTGWENPARSEIKRLRKACASEAASARNA